MLYIVYFNNQEEYEDFDWDFMIVEANSVIEAKTKVYYIIETERDLHNKECRDSKGIGVWQINPSGYWYDAVITEVEEVKDKIIEGEKLKALAIKLRKEYLGG